MEEKSVGDLNEEIIYLLIELNTILEKKFKISENEKQLSTPHNSRY